MKYISEGSALVKRRRIDPEHVVLFRADGIRQERTGVHARVSLDCNGATLAWSNFNVERDEERVRLANSAYRHIKELQPVYPDTHLKSDVDQFCAGLWDATLAQSMPEMMAGADKRIGPVFLLKPYIIDGSGTILFAPPGRGKSYTLLLMAVCMDAGLSSLWPVQRRKVLFVNLERSAASVRQRLGNVNAVLGLERSRPIATLNARGRSLVDVAAACERYITEEGVGCIFVDSISRAGIGDLNNNDAVNRIVDQLNRFKIAWFGLGHTPRADESHLFGSIHFEAGADLIVQLLSEQEVGGPLGIGLQLPKKNDVGAVPFWVGALEFDELGLTGVRLARPGEFPGIEAGKKITDREAIRQHLIDMGARSASDLEDELGIRRDKVARILSSDDVFVKTGRDGHKILYGVLDSNNCAGGLKNGSILNPSAQLASVQPEVEPTHLEPEALPW